MFITQTPCPLPTFLAGLLGVMIFVSIPSLKGWDEAQVKLGACYVRGEGVTKDYIEAYKWCNLAASQGDVQVKKLLSSIEPIMTREQIAEGQRLSAAFVPRKETPGSSSDNSTSPENPTASGSGFFITDDGYLISNYHVVKAATKVRLVTSAGTIDAKMVQVDAANDLALLKAVGRFAPLPILSSRSAHLGGTVATIGFPDPSLQGFSPKLAKGEIASLSAREMTRAIFKSACRCSRAIRAGRWWMSGATSSASSPQN